MHEANHPLDLKQWQPISVKIQHKSHTWHFDTLLANSHHLTPASPSQQTTLTLTPRLQAHHYHQHNTCFYHTNIQHLINTLEQPTPHTPFGLGTIQHINYPNTPTLPAFELQYETSRYTFFKQQCHLAKLQFAFDHTQSEQPLILSTQLSTYWPETTIPTTPIQHTPTLNPVAQYIVHNKSFHGQGILFPGMQYQLPQTDKPLVAHHVRWLCECDPHQQHQLINQQLFVRCDKPKPPSKTRIPYCIAHARISNPVSKNQPDTKVNTLDQEGNYHATLPPNWEKIGTGAIYPVTPCHPLHTEDAQWNTPHLQGSDTLLGFAMDDPHRPIALGFLNTTDSRLPTDAAHHQHAYLRDSAGNQLAFLNTGHFAHHQGNANTTHAVIAETPHQEDEAAYQYMRLGDANPADPQHLAAKSGIYLHTNHAFHKTHIGHTQIDIGDQDGYGVQYRMTPDTSTWHFEAHYHVNHYQSVQQIGAARFTETHQNGKMLYETDVPKTQEILHANHHQLLQGNVKQEARYQKAQETVKTRETRYEAKQYHYQSHGDSHQIQTPHYDETLTAQTAKVQATSVVSQYNTVAVQAKQMSLETQQSTTTGAGTTSTKTKIQTHKAKSNIQRGQRKVIRGRVNIQTP